MAIPCGAGFLRAGGRRHGSTAGLVIADPTLRSPDIDHHDHHRLREQGHVLLSGPFGTAAAVAMLRRIGRLVPQHGGGLAHRVVATSGFERRRYSKSTNAIGVHTEAPGWDPPPRYLALYCHTQAGCGGGHTDLVDGRAFLATLPPETVEKMRSQDVAFPAGRGGFLRRPLLVSADDGEDILRFSYNLLTYGDTEPCLGAEPSLEGSFGGGLAVLAEEFRVRHRTRVLIPEGGLLVWDNWRMLHARLAYRDARRRLTRYWLAK
ncbi:TauD/TfdA family dioxygenase [Streptosporangium sp. OZ121]|uniref:TauD/TfdA family dioxygenase n=1 Tax=Streptosporangium sp. OZ121 TaxID=3444183 RepID=UPI003F7B2511